MSVIVPVRDDPRLEWCLSALALQTVPADAFEVVVVDDGRDGGPSRALAKRFGVRHAHQPARGSYAARALGADMSRGEILVFTDADCRPPPDWLERVDRLFADPECQVVIGRSSSAGRATVALWAQAIDDARWKALTRLDRVAFCDTRNLAMRRAVLRRVGFDVDFRHAGDVDLGLRLFAAGYEIRLVAELEVAHDNPRSVRAMLARGVRRGRGIAGLVRKHGPSMGRTGERPLRIGGLDVKGLILRIGHHPLLRWAMIAVVATMIVPLLVTLGLMARLPGGRAAGQGLFVTFERLTLLLGRLLG